MRRYDRKTVRRVLLVCLVLSGLTLVGTGALAGQNLARLGAATASSTFSGDYVPRFSNDGSLTTRWSAGAGDSSLWYQVEWENPRTFNAVSVHFFPGYHTETLLKVEVWDSGSSSWTTVATVGDGATLLPMTTTASFAKVTSKKVRISKMTTFYELEVYNDSVSGQVTATGSGKPVAGVLVDAGDDSSVTDPKGYYHLSLAPGTYPVTLSRYYQYATGSVTAVADSVTTTNLQLASANLAPLGTAVAGTSYEGYPAEYCNDDNRNTRWSTSDVARPFEIDWTSDQTFDSLIVRFFAGYHTETLIHVDVWDSNASDWVEVATVGDPEGYVLLPLVTVVNLSPQTTSKVRIRDVVTFNELEVYNGLAEIAGNVLDSGSPVGCVTVQGGCDNSTTQDDGYYSFLAPLGSVMLRTHPATYEALTIPQTLTSAGLWQDLNVTRTSGNLVALEGATVTSSTEHMEHPAAYAYDGSLCTSWRVDDGQVTGWIQVEWPSAQTVDTIVAEGAGLLIDASAAAWVNDEWVSLGTGWTATGKLSFIPVQTTKLAINGITSVPELEVYNLKGAAPSVSLTGTVTNADSGAPIAGATVTAGGLVTYTTATGKYYLAPPSGDTTVTVSHMNYGSASKSIYVPVGGSIGCDFALSNTNLAPQATATASTEYAGFPAGLANDDNPLTRWSATDRISTLELAWPSAVTVNRVKVHQHCDPYGGWGVTQLRADYWDGAAWKLAGTVSGLVPPIPSTIDLPIALTTTTKIKLTGMISTYEIEVLAATEVVSGTISEVRDLPDGTTVQASGSITAVFEDIGAGYLESTNRVSGIRVAPLDKLGYVITDSGNLAIGATASAQDYYGPGYEPSKANDANQDTFWSAADRGRWLQMEWPGSPQTFNTIIVYNVDSSWNSPTLTVEVRDNQGNWQQVDSKTNGPNTVKFTFAAATSDAVRVTGLTAVREMEVRHITIDSSGVLTNREVTVLGTMSTVGSERQILIGQLIAGDLNPLEALAMPGKAFTTGSSKPSTMGLLTTTWGRVKAMTPAPDGKNYLYIDDGSGLPSEIDGVTGIRVGPLVTDVFPGQFVQATGIASAANAGGVDFVTLRPRSNSEVVKHSVVGPNLAPLGVVTAQTEFGPGYEATKLNDSNYGSRWSGSAADQWVQLAWTEAQTFNTVVLFYNDVLQYNQAQVTLQAWDDGTQAFVDVVTVPAGKAVLTISVPTMTTTKIRLLHVTTFYELEARLVN